MEATTVRFAAAVRALATASRRLGLAVPAFRSPPRVPGADRTLRRGADGTPVVAVRRRGRPYPAVLADLVEGVVVANGLDGVEAARARDGLWHAVEAAGLAAAGPVPHAERVARRPSLRSVPTGRSAPQADAA